ncbi:MAG: hypothetical protein WHU94_04665 [Thermogemmata sp.]|uniref:Uncharacterized protein n=1 Tax=Thermogemmata fonticola TaxID=2755323 RepID=A0A7V8VB04_9BACT|nr:hypothetical protein [Thermogemmata fonticola]MBA2224729.1 hypothetical protein [Thermogemmata fonticola]MCX8140576.1 hypothetical protein [Gemmataceae bacterium]
MQRPFASPPIPRSRPVGSRCVKYQHRPELCQLMTPNTPAPINLIRVFDFYLALMFLISLMRRWRVYYDALRLLLVVRGRWPKLLQRLAEHRSELLNWAFFRPVLAALLTMSLQLIASRLIWPQATLTWEQLQAEVWLIPVLLLPLLPMLAVDTYFLIRVGRFDHDETVRYLSLAENWLGWRGRLVRAATLGFVDPRRMVDAELCKTLREARTTFSLALWWVALQAALRILFGLTLWLIWAAHG